MLRAYANGRKDDLDGHLAHTEFAINKNGIDARRRLDTLLHRLRRTSLSPPHHELAN